MNSERRKYPRFNLTGVVATLTLNHPSLAQLRVNGEVMDMSHSGIKIHLDTPIFEKLDGRQIIIELVLPESGIPLTIRGVIKHQLSSSEYGLYYESLSDQDGLDKFIFECTKSLKSDRAFSPKQEPC
ncbi:MAG: PilZ domain-containing protein [Methylococcales bacterium]